MRIYFCKMYQILLFIQLVICVVTSIRPSDLDPSVCSLPLIQGYCLAYMERYGYDIVQGKCVMFVYGGCRGNANNFFNLRDCRRLCENVQDDDDDIMRTSWD